MRRAIWANARCFLFAATVGECVAMHHTNGFHSLCARQYCDTPDVDGPKISEAPNAFGASHKTLQSRGSEFYFEGLGQSKTG